MCATACSQAVLEDGMRCPLLATKQWYTAFRIALCSAVLLGSQTSHADEATRYMVVVTGSEILAGAFPDGHTHFLARTLRPLGLQCVGSMTVDDGQAHIRAALAYAADRADLVIVTGGLGPTDNDVTCEAISEFTGIAVKEHPEVLAIVATRFRTPVEQLRANLKRQTRVPVDGFYLQNANGTAVGLVFETTQGAIVALPGPPRELQPMVEEQLIPYLSRRFGTRRPGSSLTVRFVGLGQSSIDQRMKQHVTLPEGVAISSQFDGRRVDFTFSLPEENGENRQRLEKLKQEILEALPENVYATEVETSLEDAAIALLKDRGAKLALAEIASGGCVEAALTGARDSEDVLTGGYTAPDAESMRRMIAGTGGTQGAPTATPPRVEQLAGLLAAASSRQWAIVVGERTGNENRTGIADVAICRADGRTTAFPVTVRGRDAVSRARLTTRIVDELRKRLLEK